MRAQPPTHRPTWVIVLTSIMLLTGGYSLVGGLSKLRDPSVALTMGATETAGTEAQVKLNQQLAAVRVAAVQTHRGIVRVEAVFEILLALFTLYATAAVLSRDRRGRALTLGVGGLGIAYQIATLPVHLSLMHEYAERGADLLAQVVLLSAGNDTTVTAAELAGRLRSALIGTPIVITIVSIAGSLVLLMFFGGRRGKALYGIDRPASPRPGGVG